jgi:hypothetical protein
VEERGEGGVRGRERDGSMARMGSQRVIILDQTVSIYRYHFGPIVAYFRMRESHLAVDDFGGAVGHGAGALSGHKPRLVCTEGRAKVHQPAHNRHMQISRHEYIRTTFLYLEPIIRKGAAMGRHTEQCFTA